MKKLLNIGIKVSVLSMLLAFNGVASPRGAALERDLRKVPGVTVDKLNRGITTDTPRGIANATKTVKGNTTDKVKRSTVVAAPRLIETYPSLIDDFKRLEPVSSK